MAKLAAISAMADLFLCHLCQFLVVVVGDFGLHPDGSTPVRIGQGFLVRVF
jgi:hypothetical protein